MEKIYTNVLVGSKAYPSCMGMTFIIPEIVRYNNYLNITRERIQQLQLIYKSSLDAALLAGGFLKSNGIKFLLSPKGLSLNSPVFKSVSIVFGYPYRPLAVDPNNDMFITVLKQMNLIESVDNVYTDESDTEDTIIEIVGKHDIKL